MPIITLHVGQTGKLEGLTERDKRAYAKFRKRVSELGDSSITFEWHEPRSGPYHRRFFAMLNALLNAQEQFDDLDQLLAWLKVGAGFADMVPGPNGKPCALPRSIAWARLDQAEFEPIAEAILDFARSPRATRFLWPHLSDEDAMRAVDAIFSERFSP